MGCQRLHRIGNRWIKSQRDVSQSVRTSRGIAKYSLSKWRTTWLDGKNPSHEFRPRVSNQPGHHASLGVGYQDSRTNAIEKRGTGLLHCPLLIHRTGEGRNGGGIVGVESWITHEPGSRPLRVKVRLRPKIKQLWSGEASFDQLCRVGFLCSVSRKPSGACSRCLVNEVDFVALFDQPRRPSLPPVGGVEPVL